MGYEGERDQCCPVPKENTTIVDYMKRCLYIYFTFNAFIVLDLIPQDKHNYNCNSLSFNLIFSVLQENTKFDSNLISALQENTVLAEE